MGGHEGERVSDDGDVFGDHIDGNLRMTKDEAKAAAKQEKREKDSDEVSSDVESMLREMDPTQRHIKQLKIKKKEMERKRPKPMPKLSQYKRGWNAPLDKPYVPVGKMTELVSAVEQVRVNLPHTRERFLKTTYRQML